LTAFNNQNFSKLFNCSIPNAEISFSYDNKGSLVATVIYNSSLQGQNASLEFNPPQNESFTYTPKASTLFTIDPSNNVGAYYYDSSLYGESKTISVLSNVLLYLSLVGLLIGMLTSKFIGV
jgi:hypothetical protein